MKRTWTEQVGKQSEMNEEKIERHELLTNMWCVREREIARDQEG